MTRRNTKTRIRPGLRQRLARFVHTQAVLVGLSACGCTVTSPGDFPARLVDADGQTITVEQVELILEDDALTDDQKREDLRDLGIRDEMLIDALLTY